MLHSVAQLQQPDRLHVLFLQQCDIYAAGGGLGGVPLVCTIHKNIY